MLPITAVEQLSDCDLLDVAQRVARDERQATAHLLALLGELDVRRLYLGQSCSSLFTYCTEVLHLSEHAAYHRIEAARAARQFPIILELVTEGALTLTVVAILRPHLTKENHAQLLAEARHKSKRDVEYQIACLAPRADERTLVRRIPAARQQHVPSHALFVQSSDTGSQTAVPRTPTRPVLAPLARDRYLLKVTVSAATHAKLRRAQDLMRHTIPNGDPAAIIDRALTILVEQLERSRSGATSHPKPRQARASHGRHVPAAVKRTVWSRDAGRCAFVGANGRCRETAFLEVHHVVPFADGGATDADNLELRCRAHNAYEARLWLREEAPAPMT